MVALLALAIALAIPGARAYAQGGSALSSLTGSVVDANGGVMPGATVVVKNDATGVVTEVVTNATGAFSVPALPPGTYTVTVSISGFKTYVANNVRLLAARPGELKVTLEIGNLTETVEVVGGSELVQTQSPTISSTISLEQVQALPLVSRNALNFAVFLPGVETTGGPRGSTISGLPQNTINITLDGVNVSNNLQSGDGFFSLVVPSVDAVEEVTVTTATQGADAAGQGATQIRFSTRSGTNSLSGSGYHYYRSPRLNSNYFFNKVNGLDKNDVILHQAGGRVGGPIVIPGLIDGRGRAFFFFNYEQFYQPTEVTRTRGLLNTTAQRGLYSYTAGSELRQVDLLALAAANGHTSTVDPTIAALLAKIRAGAETTGNITTEPDAVNTDSYIYQAPAKGDRYFPTSRVDINVTPAHRLSGTYYWQRFISSPDILNSVEPRFPGLSNFGQQTSYRTSGSITLRSTLGANLVNELLGGWQWSPVEFFTNVTPAHFEEQGGFALNFPAIETLTDPSATSGPSSRNTVNWNIDNTLNWLKGNHTMTMGFSFTEVVHNQNTFTIAPTLTLNVDTNDDPARTMFNSTNFPGASTGELTDARELYALLTGRITQISGTGRLSADTNQYVYNGQLFQKARMRTLGLFAQDSWRATPTLTLSYGMRWELQLPVVPLTSNWSASTLNDLCGISGVGSGPDGRQCNLFQPGNIPSPDVVPQYVQYTPNSKGYSTDWNNFAPNVGVAWRPNVQQGVMRTILGDPDTATIRGGFSVSYNRPRMDEFTGVFAANPGGTINATRNNGSGYPLVGAGESWPLLLRDTSRLGPPAFPVDPSFPITASFGAGNDIQIFDPDIQLPSTRSWSVGLQRSLGRDTAIEVRYVGNRNVGGWVEENWNEVNINSNGFFDEFKLAQQNLRANLEAGRGATFRYFGAGTGTSPLPIYLANFSGVPVSQAGDASRYTSTNFSNTAWTGHLGQYEPDPEDAANDLWASATFRNNALAAGLPRNFFVLNPAVDDAQVNRGVDNSRYHSLQVELRRRLSAGLTVQGSYTFAKQWNDTIESLSRNYIFLQNAGVPHAFKGTWAYQIPVGRGRRFGTDMHPVLNGILGNWEFSGTGRVQIRDFALNNARIVGMDEDELREAFRIRIVRDAAGTTTVFNMPDDIIENTRRAYNTDPGSLTGYGDDGPPTGRYIAPVSTPGCVFVYNGDCGQQQIRVKGPWFTRFDVRFKKAFPIRGRANFELDVEVLNLFDNINFNPAFNPGGGSGVFVVTSAYTDINTTQDPGGRLGQIVWRINW